MKIFSFIIVLIVVLAMGFSSVGVAGTVCVTVPDGQITTDILDGTALKFKYERYKEEGETKVEYLRRVIKQEILMPGLKAQRHDADNRARAAARAAIEAQAEADGDGINP